MTTVEQQDRIFTDVAVATHEQGGSLRFRARRP